VKEEMVKNVKTPAMESGIVSATVDGYFSRKVVGRIKIINDGCLNGVVEVHGETEN